MSVKIIITLLIAVLFVFSSCVQVEKQSVSGDMSSIVEDSCDNRYSSTATLVLVSEDDSEGFDANQLANDYNIVHRIMDECVIMLKSRTVLDAVGKDLGLVDGYSKLANSIVVENPEETRVIRITAIAESPEMAKNIADGICLHGIKAFEETYSSVRFRIFEEATINVYPIK